MRTDQIKMAMHNQPFMVDTRFLDNALSVLNNGAVKDDLSVSKVANNNVTYETIRDMAVISIDGAMYKKGMSGACGETIVSYTDIIKAINTAEADENVKTIIFRVDTPGGSVAGADEVEDRIFNSSKHTITFYENQGTSGGMYIFLASKEVYAAPNTILGSIGVILTMMEDEGDKKVIHMTSSNAENKVCNLGEGCQERIQARLDVYENRFYDLVIKNTGRTAEDIKTTFNNGDVAFAEKALDAGFIDGIMVFRELLNRNGGMKQSENIAKVQAKGESMNVEELLALPNSPENFLALQAGLKTLHLAKITSDSRLSEAMTTIIAKDEEISTLRDQITASADAAVTQFSTRVEARVNEAMACGVSDASIVMNMIKEEDDQKASQLAISSNEEEPTVIVDGGAAPKVAGISAYAEKYRGKVRA